MLSATGSRVTSRRTSTYLSGYGLARPSRPTRRTVLTPLVRPLERFGSISPHIGTERALGSYHSALRTSLEATLRSATSDQMAPWAALLEKCLRRTSHSTHIFHIVVDIDTHASLSFGALKETPAINGRNPWSVHEASRSFPSSFDSNVCVWTGRPRQDRRPDHRLHRRGNSKGGDRRNQRSHGRSSQRHVRRGRRLRRRLPESGCLYGQREQHRVQAIRRHSCAPRSSGSCRYRCKAFDRRADRNDHRRRHG